MAGIFDPRCSQPVYLIESEQVAMGCGRLSGTIAGLIVGAIFGILAWTALRMFKLTSVLVSVVVAAFVFVLCLFLFRAISGAMLRQRYKASQLNIDRLEKMGMSRTSAIAQEGQLYATEQLADSNRSSGDGVGSFLGGALLGSILTN